MNILRLYTCVFSVSFSKIKMKKDWKRFFITNGSLFEVYAINLAKSMRTCSFDNGSTCVALFVDV